MSIEPSHPNAEKLTLWLNDQLDPQDVEIVEEHLTRCEDCAESLDRLRPAEDQLVLRLRHAYASVELNANTHQTLPSEHSTESELSTDLSSVESCLEARSMKRWKIVRLLGAGGIGEVWEADDTLLGRRVAVKKLRYETAQSTVVQRRFLYEARITSQLSHPGTVHVLDLIENGAESYYVMSLIHGETLQSVIANAHSCVNEPNRPINGQLLPLLRHWMGIAKTISYAHSEQILHRDLKSENVIVGKFGQVTVLDWGLAKRIGDDDPRMFKESSVAEANADSAIHTQQGARLGTPSFMSPEQASGNVAAIDERTDVWGLAALLYEILVGEPPFVGGEPGAVMQKVINEPAVPPSQRLPSIPEELSEICLKGLHKTPGERFQSASEFAEAVEEWMNTESTRRESEEARQRLFDISDDLMVVFNKKPEVLWINSAWTRVLGWEPEDLLGKEPNIVAHPDEVRRDYAILKKLAQGEIASGHERRTQTKNGDYRWYSWSLTPVLEEGIICAIGRDIDAQRKREQEYLSLLNAAPNATVVINSNRNIYMVNDQLTELFGYKREELVGEPIELLLPQRFEEMFDQLAKAECNDPNYRPLETCEGLLGRRQDGAEFEVAIRLSPAKTETQTRYVASIRKV